MRKAPESCMASITASCQTNEGLQVLSTKGVDDPWLVLPSLQQRTTMPSLPIWIIGKGAQMGIMPSGIKE